MVVVFSIVHYLNIYGALDRYIWLGRKKWWMKGEDKKGGQVKVVDIHIPYSHY